MWRERREVCASGRHGEARLGREMTVLVPRLSLVSRRYRGACANQTRVSRSYIGDVGTVERNGLKLMFD